MQATYYALTAIVPFVSRSAFERVTGPKTEWWLVLTVAALVGAVAGELGVAARGEPGLETVVLGAGSAAGLGLIDAVYVSRRRISPVYLIDAALQFPLAVGWVMVARRDGTGRPNSRIPGLWPQAEAERPNAAARERA